MAITKVKSGVRTLGTGEVVDANIATDTISIGKISGSAAASADTFLKKDGTWSEVASGIEWQAVQTTGFTAVVGKGYPCNTTAGAFTVTLPSAASVGDQISIVDYAGTFDTNMLGINPNGLNFKGATATLYAETEREGLTLTYIDATQGWVVTSGSNEGTPAVDKDMNVDFLVIAGGGGGGHGGGGNGGGGGAGGYRNSFGSEASGGGGTSEASLTFSAGTVYTVTVGAGGGSQGDGVDSSLSGSGITTITSVGGGSGGNYSNDSGGAGGSGGGGGQTSGGSGSGTANQGYAGGANSYNAGSGGGGASAVGQNGVPPVDQGGDGGDGLASSITGASVSRGGGGGGSNHGAASSQGGLGGTGGGGNGRYGGTAAQAGTVNTGGGGGGQGESIGGAGAGGSGVVILSIADGSYSGTTTGSPTVATGVSGKTVITFNGDGSYTG